MAHLAAVAEDIVQESVGERLSPNKNQTRESHVGEQ